MSSTTVVSRVTSGRRGVAWWLLCASLLVHVPIAGVAVRNSYLANADLDNYYNLGTRPGQPYVDFEVEFPIATTQTFRGLAPAAGSRQRFGGALVGLNLAADFGIVA